MQSFERQKARLAKKIRQLRHERKLTQETAAEQIGVHPKQLQRLESATKNVTLINLVAVAHAYKVSVKDLFD